MYNLTAEQLQRDKHSQSVSLSLSQCVSLGGLGRTVDENGVDVDWQAQQVAH